MASVLSFALHSVIHLGSGHLKLLGELLVLLLLLDLGSLQGLDLLLQLDYLVLHLGVGFRPKLQLHFLILGLLIRHLQISLHIGELIFHGSQPLLHLLELSPFLVDDLLEAEVLFDFGIDCFLLAVNVFFVAL